MIHGTGIDIIETERIEKAIGRWGNSFLTHVFNKEEIDYAKKYKYPTQHFAARFAAKEAIVKAIGDNAHIGWKDITLCNDLNGTPFCKISKKKFNKKIFISLSHTHNYAVATAVAVRRVPTKRRNLLTASDNRRTALSKRRAKRGARRRVSTNK